VAGKARAKAAHEVKAGRSALAGLGERFAAFRVQQSQAAAGRFIAETPPPQGGLQSGPIIGLRQCLRDEKPKAHKEPLVDDFVTPRFPSLTPLHLQPDKIAQHRPRRLVPVTAQRLKALPQDVIILKKGSRP
jgi:hypothetical protein